MQVLIPVLSPEWLIFSVLRVVCVCIDLFFSCENIICRLRGGDIHTMFLLANRSTGALTEALRCTGKADCVNDAQALFTQSAFSLV
jgi:hypothetical protein